MTTYEMNGSGGGGGGGVYYDDEPSTDVLQYPPLEIPLRSTYDTITNKPQVVAFDPLDLPEQSDDVLDVLVGEEPPQKIWLRFAAAYFRIQKPKEAEKILIKLKGDYEPWKQSQMAKKGVEGEFKPDKIYHTDMEGRALVGNALAAIYLHFAREARLASRQIADKADTNIQEKSISIYLLDQAGGFRQETKSVSQLLALAESLLNQAEIHCKTEKIVAITFATRGEVQMEQHLTKIAKGVLVLQSDIDKSLNQVLQMFSSSLEYRQNGMRAMFGKAAILFQKGQFKEARDLYCRAIERYPGADPGPTRVSLGLCYYELGQEGRAQECFERALELDPNCVDAQVCLAIIEMGLATDADRAPGATAQELARNLETARRLRERAHDRLRVAYDLDKWNPLLKVHLANLFFYSNESNVDYKRVNDLAKEAFHHTTSKHIKAEACFILARNWHDKKNERHDPKQASTLYTKSLENWASFPLARYGHAQMELAQASPDMSAALRAMELVMESPEGKDDEDCLLVIGCLYAKMGAPQALSSLRRVTEKNVHRTEAWIQQALIEQEKYRSSLTAAEEAIRCYDKAVAALRFHNDRVPFELWNNLGALKFRVQDFSGSVEAYDEALKIKGWTGTEMLTSPEVEPVLVTILYNKARSLEGLGQFSQAQKMYLQILSWNQDDKYVDAQLRLALLAASTGDFETALETYMKPLAKDAKLRGAAEADFYSVWGNLETDRAKLLTGSSLAGYAYAKAHFERIIDEKRVDAKQKHDPYARISLANLDFDKAQAIGVVKKEDKAERDKAVSAALGIYRSVLRMYPKCVFAVNGIGACFSARGHYQDARNILDRIRELADTMCPSVYVNLAHVYLHEGQYDQAANLYDQALKRFYDNRDPEVSLFVANARFHSGKYPEARQAIVNALKQSPSDENLWFGLATINEIDSYQKLNLDDRLLSSAGIEKQLQSLQRALDIYQWMMAKGSALALKKQRASQTTTVMDDHSPSPALVIPHDPKAPVKPNKRPWEASSILLARAQIAADKLRGRSPDASALQVLAQADMLKASKKKEEEEALKRFGRRSDLDRAMPERIPSSLSSSAVQRLSALASKRADVVKEQMKKSLLLLETVKKREKKNEMERLKQQNILAEEARKREEKLRELMLAEQARERKTKEAERKVAEVNKEKFIVIRESEALIQAGGERKSGRQRNPTQRLREAKQTGLLKPRRSKKANRKNDASSDEDDEEEEEEDEEEEEEEEEEDEDDKKRNGDDEEEEDKLQDEREFSNENERMIAQEIERMIDSKEFDVNDPANTTSKLKSMLRSKLGDEIVDKAGSSKFITERIMKRVTPQQQPSSGAGIEEKKENQVRKKIKLVSDDADSSEEDDDDDKNARKEEENGVLESLLDEQQNDISLFEPGDEEDEL